MLGSDTQMEDGGGEGVGQWGGSPPDPEVIFS